MALGNQVKKYRDQLGWTLLQLEEHSGVDTGTINALEVRDSSRSKYGTVLARAMGLSLDQLLDETRTYTARATPLATDTTGTYNVQPIQAAEGISLDAALSALCRHMTGLDPPVRGAIGVLISGMCADPEKATTTAQTIRAMLAVQGNNGAQKSTNSQAA